ncbi:MAG: primosomal protein N' [Candidatus Omnitrophica bacterium]|nr:primosomal protein N' [Candidatus Omnitrophota bacterium]
MGLPVQTTFHYSVPKQLQEQAAVGKRVRIPFRNRQLIGYIVGVVGRPEGFSVKPILEVLDQDPILGPDLVELTRWIGKKYLAGWGETIEAALPGPIRKGRLMMKSRSPEPAVEVSPSSPLPLNAEQKQALDSILAAVNRREHRVFLLHGVTGSGKTEVYLQAIQEILSQGKTSIVLVPEISLTPQTIERFQARFGAKTVAVLHSAMLESQRLQEWHRIRLGEAHVVVGARSAVFAPVQSLGLVVIDEEHEPSYKQEDAPRYHAREVAITRAKAFQAPVILGSATPAIETYYQATQRRIELLPLRSRIEEVPLPQVEIVDMRQEFGRGSRGKIFSRQLEETLAQTLTSRQQAILFLNRRGFSPFIHCRGCGQILRCKSCQVTLTYHMDTRSMVCHTCHSEQPAPEICPKCRSEYIRFQGIGTQRVESELARLFPQASIARMDTDSMKARGSHAKLLSAFRRHEIDVLVGTQMVAKGLDFPRVTLVGVISADTALNLPDFRSAERTFNLLTQVAGRAGRGALPGKVILQTYTPHHYGIVAAGRHDYLAFYQQEIEARRQCGLPPFTHLVQLTVRSLGENKALEYAKKIAQTLRRCLLSEVQILGPSPAPVHRVRRNYLWQLLLKSPEEVHLKEPLAAALREVSASRGCRLAIDVDPL